MLFAIQQSPLTNEHAINVCFFFGGISLLVN